MPCAASLLKHPLIYMALYLERPYGKFNFNKNGWLLETYNTTDVYILSLKSFLLHFLNRIDYTNHGIFALLVLAE